MVLMTRSLAHGGAERQIVQLALGLADRGQEVHVVTFYGGVFQRELDCSDVDVRVLEKRGRWDVLGFAWRLLGVLRDIRPMLLYSFLPLPNLVAMLAREVLPGRVRLVWGLRASDMQLHRYDWLERLSRRGERMFSSAPDLILANSRAGREVAVRSGYPSDRMKVVENGIDTDRFRPRPDKGGALRRELGVEPDEWLVGRVGRLDPMKDYPTFLRAAVHVSEELPGCRFLCVGASPDPVYRSRLTGICEQLGLAERVVWSSPRDDMPAVYSAMDVSCSSSAYGEGFPNVVAESMACGVPCVVTDVGDSARIVGEPGRVVPPSRPRQLAHALVRVLRSMNDAPDHGLRERIVSRFATSRMVDRTVALLEARLA